MVRFLFFFFKQKTAYEMLRSLVGSEMCIRDSNRGRRAGAINDVLNVIEGAEYIALFDVDSRPNIDFLTECVSALTEASNGVLASGCRFVTNKESTLTKIISIEYKFFCDIYRLGRWSGGFIQFNGLIGVSKAAFLRSTVFNERCACEDVDITQQILSLIHISEPTRLL